MVVLVVVLIVVRSITRPLHLVTENVRRIASDRDFTRKITVHSGDEIGVFVTHFNQMADMIKDHIGKLEDYSQNLEKMVEERTEQILAQKEEIERKSEEIRRSEKKYRQLLEAANEGVVIFTDKRIKMVNPRLEKMCGYTAQELVSMKMSDMVFTDDRLRIDEYHQLLLEKKHHAKPEEFRIVNRTGDAIWILSSAVVIEWESRSAILEFITDITDRKNAEEELSRKNRELSLTNSDLTAALAELKTMQIQLIESEKMAFLGNLAAGMAHEINNPVGVISSTVDVIGRCGKKMVEAFSENDPGRETIQNALFQKSIGMLHTCTETITTATARITKIVSSLNNFVRLDEAEFQTADIHEGIESTFLLLQHKLDQKIRIIKKFGSVPKISCYPHMLNQIFMILLKRSVGQCNNRGSIEIVTATEGDHITIVIANDGTPMTEDERVQLFDMNLKPVKNRVKFDMEFASVHNILKQHHGTISIAQDVQWNNIFRVALPVSGG